MNNNNKKIEDKKPPVSLLSMEAILSINQLAQHQITVYRAFVKACEGDITEALIQTEIHMRALFQGTKN